LLLEMWIECLPLEPPWVVPGRLIIGECKFPVLFWVAAV